MPHSIQLKKNETLFLKKGSVLLRQGDKCKVTYQVKTGCLKRYIIDREGKEHILQFAPEGWIISDMNSFINDTESAVFIDAIEDTEVELITRSARSAFENASKEFLNQVISKFTNNIIALDKRITLLLASTAEERYLDFIKTYPSLLQRLPLKLIAAYIGITPEYLSELRNKMAKR